MTAFVPLSSYLNLDGSRSFATVCNSNQEKVLNHHNVTEASILNLLGLLQK